MSGSRSRLDDEEERRAGPLLLGKAAVLAHRFERPMAAEMDEYEQSARAAGLHGGVRSYRPLDGTCDCRTETPVRPER